MMRPSEYCMRKKYNFFIPFAQYFGLFFVYKEKQM